MRRRHRRAPPSPPPELHLDEQLQVAAVMLTRSRLGTNKLAKDRRGRPQGNKGRHREGAVQTSPPVKTESSIIQGANIYLGTQPIPLNSLTNHLGDKPDDALTTVMKVRILRGLLGSNPLLPQGTNGSNTEHRPKAKEVGWRARVRPVGEVIAEEKVRRARELDMGQGRPSLQEPIHDRGRSRAIQEAVGQGVQVALVSTGLQMAERSRWSRGVVQMPACAVEKGPTPQGAMQQMIAGDPKGPVQSLVCQSRPDFGEAWAKEAGSGRSKGRRSTITGGRASRSGPLKVQPSKLSEKGWVRKVLRLLHREGLGMDGPVRFKLAQAAEGNRVVSSVNGPDGGPSSLLLPVASNSLRGGQVEDVAVEEGCTGVTDAKVQQVDVHIPDPDAPSSGV